MFQLHPMQMVQPNDAQSENAYTIIPLIFSSLFAGLFVHV